MPITIKKIIDHVLSIREALPLHYVPQKHDKKIVGIMLSGGIEVSLALANGTNLILHRQTIYHSPNIAPDKRIIQLNEPINRETIKGIVQAIDPLQPIQASIYIIIHQTSQN